MQNLPKGFAYLAAPTGKAAARMKEATGYFAETIHRLIGITEDGAQFGGRDLKGKAVVIDEASMIDSYLMATLIDANPSRLILIGDEAQLPPVGAGSPFHDLIRIAPERTVRLTQCYRNTAAVHHAAAMIRVGEMPQNASDGGETYSFSDLSSELAQQRIVDMFKSGELNQELDVVLASVYGDAEKPGGILALNNAIMSAINPHRDGQRWKIGDRVLNCKKFQRRRLVEWRHGNNHRR